MKIRFLGALLLGLCLVLGFSASVFAAADSSPALKSAEYEGIEVAGVTGDGVLAVGDTIRATFEAWSGVDDLVPWVGILPGSKVDTLWAVEDSVEQAGATLSVSGGVYTVTYVVQATTPNTDRNAAKADIKVLIKLDNRAGTATDKTDLAADKNGVAWDLDQTQASDIEGGTLVVTLAPGPDTLAIGDTVKVTFNLPNNITENVDPTVAPTATAYLDTAGTIDAGLVPDSVSFDVSFKSGGAYEGIWIVPEGTFEVTGFDFQVMVKDRYGNAFATTASGQVEIAAPKRIDGVKPSLTAVSTVDTLATARGSFYRVRSDSLQFKGVHEAGKIYVRWTATDSTWLYDGSVSGVTVNQYDTLTVAPGDNAWNPGIALQDSVEYRIVYQLEDLAGNKSDPDSLEGIRFDEEPIVFDGRFPTQALAGDTINARTAKVRFTLSEPVDSVLIKYEGIAGAHDDSVRTYSLSSSEIENWTTEQVFDKPADELADSTQYVLTVWGRDLSGNEVTTAPDTMWYFPIFQEPVLASFDVTVSAPADSDTTAGVDMTLQIRARDDKDRTVVIYDQDVTLTATGATGLTWGDPVVVDAVDPNKATIAGAKFQSGEVSFTVKDTVAEQVTITVSGPVSATDPTLKTGTIPDLTWETGALTDLLVYIGDLAVTPMGAVTLGASDDTVEVGASVPMHVLAVDKYDNADMTYDTWLTFSSNTAGVVLPNGWQMLEDGYGVFTVIPSVVGTGVTVTALEVMADTYYGTSNAIVVVEPVLPPIDPPDTLIVTDYPNDNGEWLLMSFDPSTSDIGLYRIYREITKVAGTDTTEAEKVYVSWAEVPGILQPEDDGYITVLVAMLGIMEPSNYKIAAEVGGEASAFASSMLARKVADGPFVAVPAVGEMAARGAVRSSPAVQTPEPVAPVDNIAPVAVELFTAYGTPVEEGGSITVSWSPSLDDRVISYQTSNLGQKVAIRGVTAYNIYRKTAGGEEFVQVGSVGHGVTSYQDPVDNGPYYEYDVRVADYAHEVASELAPAMAFAAKAENASKGDWTGDDKVDLADFSRFVTAYGAPAPAESPYALFDLNDSGTIDLGDFSVFVTHYGETWGGGVAKAVPVAFGKNTDASMTLSASQEADRYTVRVSLAEVAEAMSYGFVMRYDVRAFEFEDAVTKGSSTVPFLAVRTRPGELAIGHVLTEGDAEVAEISFKVKENEFGGSVQISEGYVWDQYNRTNTVDLSAAAIRLLPKAFALKQNFPNPFNPTTEILYALPEDSNVRLEVYNTLGQVVRTLVDRDQKAGAYRITWDGRSEHGQEMATGVYIYRIVAGEFHATKRMLLLK